MPVLRAGEVKRHLQTGFEGLAAIGVNQNGFHHTLSSFDVTKLRRKRTQVH